MDRFLQGELRVLNAQLPRRQKSLSELLREEHPHVLCQDDRAHLFKREELKLLAGLLESGEQERFLLPLLIEVGPKEGEFSVLCRSELEEKVLSRILKMPVPCRQGRLTLYRPQLGAVRSVLKTTTQYAFTVGSAGEPL
jgi:uncharacterized protein (UPF0216 family)